MDAATIEIITTAILATGGYRAYVAYRKTPAEVEAQNIENMVQVTSELKGIIEELRSELERKDRQISDQNKLIGQLQQTIEDLSSRVRAVEIEQGS